MSRVIVTGGSGFIGFHLSNYLADNAHDVTIIDNLSRGANDDMFRRLLGKKNVHFINADMSKKDFYVTLEGTYDYIYHLAAINGTKNFYEKPYEVLRVNILTLMNILEWCSPKNCRSFLFASSSEAYAGTINKFSHHDSELVSIPTKEDIPLTIDDVLNPRYSYGGSKITGELITANYCRTKNIPFKIARYHNIYGPRMGFDHVLSQLIKRIHDKEDPFKLYGGNETRAFCEVVDCVLATAEVMKSVDCNGEIVHIGNSSEEIKIIDILGKLLQLASFMPNIDIQPAPVGCVVRRCPNTEKLLSLTGVQATVDLEHGLQRIYDWYMYAYKNK